MTWRNITLFQSLWQFVVSFIERYIDSRKIPHCIERYWFVSFAHLTLSFDKLLIRLQPSGRFVKRYVTSKSKDTWFIERYYWTIFRYWFLSFDSVDLSKDIRTYLLTVSRIFWQCWLIERCTNVSKDSESYRKIVLTYRKIHGLIFWQRFVSFARLTLSFDTLVERIKNTFLRCSMLYCNTPPPSGN